MAYKFQIWIENGTYSTSSLNGVSIYIQLKVSCYSIHELQSNKNTIKLYTETKKFSNTLPIRIFITEIHVEITQTV